MPPRDQYDPPDYSPVTFGRSPKCYPAEAYSEINPPPWGEEAAPARAGARPAASPAPAAPRYRTPYRAPRPAAERGAGRPARTGGGMVDIGPCEEVKDATPKAFRIRLNLAGRVFELWLPKSKVIRTSPVAFRVPRWLAVKEGLPL